MRQHGQGAEESFRNHSHICACFRQSDKHEWQSDIHIFTDYFRRLVAELFDLRGSISNSTTSPFGSRLSACWKITSHFVPRRKPAGRHCRQVAADLLGHADAHVLDDLFGLAQVRCQFGDGFENEMQVADGHPLGQQKFQNGLQA